MIDLNIARTEIVKAIAVCEHQLQQSTLVIPEAQKLGIQIARAQLFGSYAMVTIALALPTEDADKGPVLAS